MKVIKKQTRQGQNIIKAYSYIPEGWLQRDGDIYTVNFPGAKYQVCYALYTHLKQITDFDRVRDGLIWSNYWVALTGELRTACNGAVYEQCTVTYNPANGIHPELWYITPNNDCGKRMVLSICNGSYTWWVTPA